MCFHSQKQIKPIDSAQQNNKNETFPTFVGHFHPEKSDFEFVYNYSVHVQRDFSQNSFHFIVSITTLLKVSCSGSFFFI